MIGLHYWTTPTPYSEHDEAHRNSPAVSEAMADFVNGGLLRRSHKPNDYGGEYEATDAMGVWVEALRNVPWPVQVWVVPTDAAKRISLDDALRVNLTKSH